MGSKGLFALGACTAALLVAPAAASALDLQSTTANTTASVTQLVGSVQGTVGTTLEGTTSSATSPEASSTTPTSSSSESGASTRDASSPSTDSEPQVELQTETVGQSTTALVGWRPKAKRAKAKAKRCARAAAGPNEGGPPAAGCTRIDGSQVNGTHQIVVNGVTITFTFTVVDTAQGPVLTWTSDVPYSGTIFVKGGPDFPGFACTYDTPTTSDTSGNCHPPVNQSNGKYYGVSHIDVCPPGTTTEPPSTTSNPPSTTTKGEEPKENKQGVLGEHQKGTKGEEAQGVSPVAATATSSGEQLPFTGANVLWLVAIACALTGSGMILRGLRA